VAAAFRVTSGLLICFVLVVSGPAGARAAPQDSPAAATPATQARDAFKSAQVHYDLKEYGAALEDFKTSYRLVQDPVMLFNIAQCHFFLGQNEEALGFYRNFLRRSPDAPNRATVERKIQDLERKVAAAAKANPTVATPAPPAGSPGSLAPAPVVSPPSSTTPPPVTASVPAPVITSAGSSGPTAPTAIDLSTPVPPEPAPGGSPPIWKRWWFWTGIGAVVAVGVVAGVAAGRRGQVGDCMDNRVCLKVGGQ
jgi:hypothetical protein